MAKRLVIAIVAALGLLTQTLNAKTDAKADLRDAERRGSIEQFNLGHYPTSSRHETLEQDRPQGEGGQAAPRQISVGTVQSPNVGMGVGSSIDLTFDDAQYTRSQGRHIARWWNGEVGGSAQVSVHFAYRDRPDTFSGTPHTMTGYNVYDATFGGSWPRGQEFGCDLEAADSLGFGRMPSIDMMYNGRVVVANTSRFYRLKSGGSRLDDHLIYFQDFEFGCLYDPLTLLGVTWIDTAAYRPSLMDQSDGSYSSVPQVVTQWDGANTIVHLVFAERNGTPLSGTDYVDGYDYHTLLYFRKVGNTASSGGWSAAQILDSNLYPSASLAAAPYPNGSLAFVYTNPSNWGALLNNVWDRDVYYRESNDYGLSWQPAVNISNFNNPIQGDPNHFTAWLECQALYTSDDNLHVIFTADRTSYDPYFDGYVWNDYNQNLYHWDEYNNAIVKVANGSFWDVAGLTESMNDLHCGFGGSNVGYLGWITMGECDGKLYSIWSQIHERANRFPWSDVVPQPAPGVLDDCSYTGNRMARANWEILMSVAQLSSSDLWDYPRNITNTYTPDCGLPGDPLASGPCGSEWKPSVEKYGLDESGLSLTWPPETVVDLSPGQDYSGNSYLNMEYLDDQFPGPADWGNSNPPATENSMKWVRLACVEPEEAPVIVVEPQSLDWPRWVELGVVDNINITVVNEGNVVLNVSEVGYAEATGAGWLGVSISPTPGAPFAVAAGVVNTATFDIIVDASAISQASWLDGEVWLKSDAANNDSISITIHILAAPEVEPIAWDTAQTHENMFDPYFLPEGECVALAVGNAGDLGYGAGGRGGANLDYTVSELECGSRARDSIYLKAATAFTILADDWTGSNARLSQVYQDANQADQTGFDPVFSPSGGITGGLSVGGDYDSVYTGRFVNRDTTVAMERIVYAPRSLDPVNDTISFVILYTKVYSGDGQAHDHVTVGNVCDWDIPAENAPDNTSGLSGTGNFLFVQGTDTTGILSCQSHTNRYATEAFGGGYTSDEWNGDNCINDEDRYHGVIALDQALLEDTTHYRNGDPLIPSQPEPQVWWDETMVPGLNADASIQDQAVWFTYAQDQYLGALDTLHFWTVLSTVRDGDLTDLEAQVNYARRWYSETVRGCSFGCCQGHVGDANSSGDDNPTIGDISALVDALFLSDDLSLLECLAEADANASGGANPTEDNISMGDIDALVDHIFETQAELPLCYSTDSPYSDIDPGNPDSLIATTPVLDVTAGYPRAAITLYAYNDAENLDGAQVGLGWDNAKASLESAALSEEAETAFDFGRYGYYKNNLAESNGNRRLQMSAFQQYSSGLPASPGRTKLITYYFTLNDWGQYDQLCLDKSAFLPERYVDANVSEYAPVWVSGLCDIDLDSDGDGILNDGDHSGLAGDNPCAPGESADCDDNCPYLPNPSQADADLDGKGDGCDMEPATVDHGLVVDEQGDLYYPAVGDLDLDHYPDVVFSDPTLNGVFVAYGEPGGGLEPPVRLSNTSPAAVTIDYVDSDTLPDVITVTTASVEVLFNQGGRVFSASPPTPIGATFEYDLKSTGTSGAASSPVPAVTSGYFDDDEILDLAVAPGEILLGQGDGSFGGAIALPFPFQAANVCDFDRDGRDDLAVLSGSEIKICLNDALPTASFTEEFSAPIGEPNLQMSPAHAVADFDWDGYCDFAIVTPLADPADQSMVTVILWGENLWLSQTVGIPVEGLAYDLVVADPDRDGNLDIVVANGTESRLEVYFGDGEGNFSDPAFEPLDPGQDLTYVLATLDLDRDGNPDFVSGSSGGGDIQTAYSQHPDEPIIADSGYFPMVTTGYSDASITVINPDGFVISEYARSVAGSDYRRVDADGDGQIDEQAVDYNVQPGVYTIRPLFEQGTQLNVRVDLGDAPPATLFLNYDTDLPVKCGDGADFPFEVYPPGEDPPIAPPSGQAVRVLQPSISWDGLASGPDPRYGFQMNTRHDFCGTMIDEQLGLATSGCTVQATLAEENVYYWSVLFDRNNDGEYEDVSNTYALYITSCCIGKVGNVNLSGDGSPAGEEPTIGDISVLIDYLFITGPSLGLDCIYESDVNRSGGSNPVPEDITIGDISVLIDYLYITGPTLGLNACPP